MNICCIICGLPRSIELVINNINTKFKKHKINYYICITKNHKKYENEYLNDDYNINNLLNDDNIKKIIFIEDNNDNQYRNSINYFNKIYNILQIIDNNYNLYIVIRSDLILNNVDFLNDVDDDILYFSQKKYNHYIHNNINTIDGNIIISKNYNLIVNLKNIFSYLVENNNYLDIVLFNYLEKSQIKYKKIDVDYKLILSKCNIIAIAGDSGSGKSTLLNILMPLFNKCIKLETDRYHKWERGNENYNNITHLNPNANYLEKMSDDIYNLKIGHEIYAVDYDHSSGKFTHEQQIKSCNNIILCGLHTLFNNDINNIINLKIFMDTDRELIKKWKINRDVNERGYLLDKVLKQIENREIDYNKYIKIQKNNADIIINFYEQNNLLKCNVIIQNILLFSKFYKNNLNIEHKIYDNLLYFYLECNFYDNIFLIINHIFN
jgi:uridine kinase